MTQSDTRFKHNEVRKHDLRLSTVIEKRQIANGLFVLRFEHPEIASNILPGQFVNVLPKTGFIDPLLRRPFSVYQVIGNTAEIIIQDHGKGTGILSRTHVGESIDALGPLGSPWKYDSGDFETAILVIGGVGVASMPLLTMKLGEMGKSVVSYYGARNESLFADEYLQNVRYSTDDGSRGFHGSVIENIRLGLQVDLYPKPKFFVCGPTGMMRAAIVLATEFSVPCEVSLETEMACGIGICQGCPVVTSEAENAATGKKFHLVCTQGPSFAKEQIII